MSTALAIEPLTIARGGRKLSIFPPVLSAPLAGVADVPYRQLLGQHGCPFSFTEMISAKGIVEKNPRTLELLDTSPGEANTGVQLFCSSPDVLHRAAAAMESIGYPLVDLNAGCPKRKVMVQGSGGALLKDPKKLLGCIGAMLDAVDVPVGLKMRSGYNNYDPRDLGSLTSELESAGISYLSIHCRTVEQGFKGKADRSIIEMLSSSLSIPVIASGDVRSPADVMDYIKRGAAGVMVGRALCGDPLWFESLSAALKGEGWRKERQTLKGLKAHLEACSSHLDLMISHHGERRGCIEFRPHLNWYLSGFGGRRLFRERIYSLEDRASVETLLDEVRAAWSAQLGDGSDR